MPIMNNTPDEIKKRFNNNELTFTVIGLGRIGQPAASIFAEKGIRVYGYDINENVINSLKNGKPTIDEPGLEEIIEKVVKNNLLIPTLYPKEAIESSDVIIICLPTPVTDDKNPDYSSIITCFNEISKYIQKGSLIIVESTISPGVVENMIVPTIEKNSDLKVMMDFGIASCPERSNPGEIIDRFKNNPRILGGIDNKSTMVAKTIYECVVDADVILTSNPKSANAVKLVENIFRDVNIALMNELAILFEKLEIDIYEIIKAAKTKWNFVPHYPGSGVGGPCLPANPYYLIQEAIKVEFVPHLIRFAREINDRMPHHLVELTLETLNKIGKPVKDSKISILGISYKPDVADYQLSPAFPVITELKKLGAKINVFDPYFKNQTIKNISMTEDLESAVSDTDCIIIITDHKIFIDLDLNQILTLSHIPLAIVDGRNTLDIDKIPKNVIYKSIGRLLINKS
ncbi:MAG: nucleotide sugar dehydrogenase [Candidatus Lokiarchaeota archaeon]|nr:nucleotide sugar dehydrogenase [Candidatus Lokiarchaeota archaeon]